MKQTSLHSRQASVRPSRGPGAHRISSSTTATEGSDVEDIDNIASPRDNEETVRAVAVTREDLVQEILKNSVEAKVEKKHPQRWNIIVGGILFVAAVVTSSVMIAFFLSRDNEAETTAPTESPTLSPASRVTAIQGIVRETFQTTTDMADLDGTSPQAKAVEWLAIHDAYRVDVVAEPARVLQRYVLAVLYYSLGGDDEWNESFGFLEPKYECEWSGALQCSEDGQVISLDMSGNNLVASLPAEIGALSRLELLDLEDNAITGIIPLELGELSALSRLHLSGNNLHGSIPEQIFDLTNLRSLLVGENALSGSIPPEIGLLTKLTSLSLELNMLSGRIPDSLWNLSNMEAMSLGEQFTVLEGSISPKIGNWKNLTLLSIHRNAMTGTLPTEIGWLSQLTNLQAGANDFSGTIPSEIGNLASVSRISLSVNGLTGTVPKEFLQLTNLSKLYLQNTLLLDDWTWMCDAIANETFGPLRPMRADLDEVNCPCCTCCKY